MREKKVMKLASRGKRLGAFCIDAVVPIVSVSIFFGAMIAVIVSELMYNPGFGYGTPGFGYGYGYGYGYSRGPSAGTVTALIISMLLCIAWLVVELIFFNKSKTIGKAALGLQVVSSVDGEPIGFWKMLFREWFVKTASASVFMLGFIWIVIDDKNRGWHDKILETYVVDLKESEAVNTASRTRAENVSGTAPEPVRTPSPKSAPLPVREQQAAPAAVSAAVNEEQSAAEAAPETVEEFIEVNDNSAAVRNDVFEGADVVVATAQDAVIKAAETESHKAAEEPVVIEMPGTVESAEIIEMPGTVESPETEFTEEKNEEL